MTTFPAYTSQQKARLRKEYADGLGVLLGDARDGRMDPQTAMVVRVCHRVALRYYNWGVRRGIDLEDLVQTAIVACYKYLPRHDPSRGASLVTWCYLVAKTKIVNLLTRERSVAALVDAPTKEIDQDMELDWQQMICCLPDRWRRIVEFRYHGYTFKEIGAILGVTYQRVEQLENKAMEKLSAKYPGFNRPPASRAWSQDARAWHKCPKCGGPICSQTKREGGICRDCHHKRVA